MIFRAACEFFWDALSPRRSTCTAVCPSYGKSYDDEQSYEFGGVGNMGVFDVKVTGFGVGEETFNPPSLPLEAERIPGCRDICGDQKQFAIFDLFSIRRNRFSGVRAIPGSLSVHRPLRCLRSSERN